MNVTLSSVLNGGSTVESKLIYSNDGEQSLDGFGWFGGERGSKRFTYAKVFDNVYFLATFHPPSNRDEDFIRIESDNK